MSIEVMKQALEALEQINQLSIGENAIALPGEIDAAMDNLRAAIEQAENPVCDKDPRSCWSVRCQLGKKCKNTPPAAQREPVQEPVAYDKTELNCFAQDLYDQKMREGKRGHYESMFHVIHQCVKKVANPPAAPRQWVELTEEEINYLCDLAYTGDEELILTIQSKLKEKNT